MSGRIIRKTEADSIGGLSIIGSLKIGEKVMNQNGREIPRSLDYFLPSGNYAPIFTRRVGEKPTNVVIIFPCDDCEKVCNEQWVYRDNAGAKVAYGDGQTFYVWNGKEYAPYSLEKHPDLMERVAAANPKKYPGEHNGWDAELSLNFIVPATAPDVMGLWHFSTKAEKSTIKNIIGTFDAIKQMKGTVTTTAFDLSVKYVQSNKPGAKSRYPVVSLTACNFRIEEIRQMLASGQNMQSLLLSK